MAYLIVSYFDKEEIRTTYAVVQQELLNIKQYTML